MFVRYDATHEPPAAGEERHTLPGTPAGVPLFSRQYRYMVAITPGSTVLAADGIMVTADADVTLTSADDPEATPMLVPLKAGTQYDLAIGKVTIVSTGTAYALYHRKPAS